jgi:lipoprotein-anchoring transpeptidase ErfK/SrfK
MKGLRLGVLATVTGAAVVLAAQAVGQQAPAKADAQEAQRVILVSLEDRKLALVDHGQVKKIYAVAVGKPSTPSPVGAFTIERRAKNPTYRHGDKTVLPGPGNPVGTRWMGLSIRGYGIHGTNEPNSIGKAASHGCIRMAKADLEEFYEMVAVGDKVELVGQRNAETASVFGGEQNPAAPVKTQAAPAELAAVKTAEPATSEPNAVNDPLRLAAGVALAAMR